MTGGVMLDPTLALIRRGQDWIDRAIKREYSPILVSASLLNALASDDKQVLAAYRSAWMFGYRWPRHIDGVQGVGASTPFDAVSARLLAGATGQSIAADTWRMINEGVWLAARRTPTFDQLVQAGVRLIIEGRHKYVDVADRLASDLGSDLAGSLARRSRYFAISAATSEDLQNGKSPTVLMYDAGAGAYH